MHKWKTAWFLVGLLILSGCSGGGGGDTEVPVNDPPLLVPDQPVNPDPEDENPTAGLPRADIRTEDQLFAYRAGSAYAGVLKDCALVDTASEACDLTTLPFIGQNDTVTREAIMQRLLVTHNWMGVRFEELLADAPDDLIQLFGSLTSISIGSTIRPSYYWAGTGAIRLDPAGLWLTVYEKSTVSIDDDFRSDYGRDLIFWTLGTLRLDGQQVLGYFPLTDYQERDLGAIRIGMFRLLYHELGHAVDYMPARHLSSLDSSMLPVEAVGSAADEWLARRLQSDLPLFSGTLQALAQVRYAGVQASELQKSYTPAFVGSLMGGDGGMRFYAYYTSQEDVATLLAATMLKKNFNVDSHIAFSAKPADVDDYECRELLVGWGVYNRLADPRILPRAKWVYEEIYGQSTETDLFFNDLDGTSSLMTQGLDWCANLANGVPATASGFHAYQQSLGGDDQMQILNMHRREVTH